MRFSKHVPATTREDFEDALEAATTTPPELTTGAQELIETGITLAKQIAEALPETDAVDTRLTASITGDAPSDTGQVFRTLTVTVGETAPVAAVVGG